MALVIEDGSGVAGAESFASAADFAAYAVKFGLTIPAGEPEQEALLRRAFVAMLTMPWKGNKVEAEQAGAWPRYNVVVDGEVLASDYIPARIEYGQMALAAEIYADDVTPPETRVGPVTREKVDVLEVEYGLIKNTERLLPAAPERPSRTQFADYLQNRGLFLHRA